MIYPQHFEQKIDFDHIKDLISAACISPMGLHFVDKIRFSSKKEVIEKLLDQVSEFKEIMTSGKSFPSNDYFDLRENLIRLKTPGSYIDQEALFDLRSSLKTILGILTFLKDTEDEDYPELKNLAEQVIIPEDLLLKTDSIIDDKGEIKSTASDKLLDIRKQIESKLRQVTRETKKAFELAKKSGWVPDNSEITIRDGRAVIPLSASNKRSMGGFIHDESATGQTVFVEPAGSFEINNQIRELVNDERREIIRILVVFTDHLRPYITELNGAYRFLGLIDFIRAKTLFSQKIQSERPTINSNKQYDLREAKHPLLYLAHTEAKKPVIPLDLDLNPENRILVISGPNAGGKSVCLKSIGLLQYMIQCGLHIPCSPDSNLPLFESIFLDIGDEQSLENDLSTYSSHLMNMKFFLRNANENTLFLIDEFGTGTEPQLGGAIAEATLEQLNNKEAFGVITTHYSNLKLAAKKNKGLINGAMLFDSKEMQPLYKLQIGQPGSSFAFEIAKNIGFPKYVLNRARKKCGGKHVSFDKQLQQLEVDKISIEKKQKEVQATDDHLSEMVEKYTNLLDEIKRTKKQLIEDARKEALAIVIDSNKAVERTIKEIKEAKADKLKTKEIREKLEKKKADMKAETKSEAKVMVKQKAAKKAEAEVGDGKIKIGDVVRIKNTDIIGELMDIDGSDAFLNVNEIRLKTSFKKLAKTDRQPPGKNAFRTARKRQGILNEIHEKAARFELNIDLRGKRAEEALSVLQHYVDDAILLSISEVSILHGKGDGILRPIIREYLNTIDEIKKYGDAPLDQGGAGITKVYFR